MTNPGEAPNQAITRGRLRTKIIVVVVVGTIGLVVLNELFDLIGRFPKSIDGAVVDGNSGNGIIGAEVYVKVRTRNVSQGLSHYVVVTSANGGVFLSPLVWGRIVAVMAFHPDYEPAMNDLDINPSDSPRIYLVPLPRDAPRMTHEEFRQKLRVFGEIVN